MEEVANIAVPFRMTMSAESLGPGQRQNSYTASIAQTVHPIFTFRQFGSDNYLTPCKLPLGFCRVATHVLSVDVGHCRRKRIWTIEPLGAGGDEMLILRRQ